MSRVTKLNILVYCNRPEENQNAGTVIDHIDAFSKYSTHNIITWSSLSGLPDGKTVENFDCIVIHYTLSLLYSNYIPAESFKILQNFKGIKVLFIQDEYRRVNFVCERIKKIGLDAVFSCAPPRVAQKIYHSLGRDTQLLTTLTGYVPEDLPQNKCKPMEDRTIDVGYRARKCPFFLGRKSHEKYEIGSRFLARTHATDLNCDISSQEKDRIYGSKWIEFVSNCRTTLGTESGASLIDFTGKIEYGLNRWQAFHPFANFDDVPSHFLEEDGRIDLQVISPRCFEAAALGTVMVMYPGEYSGLLEPGVHYIPLEKDFSNFEKVLSQVKDLSYLNEISENARLSLVDSTDFSYRKFIHNFDKKIEDLSLSKDWEPIGRQTAFKINTKTQENFKKPLSSKLKDFLQYYKRFTWKHLPVWFKFLLSVTLLKKWVYFHLFQ